MRLYVPGAKQWCEYPSWPPPHVTPLRLHLRGDGRLDFSAPTQDEGAARFLYDPADPTPSIHGPTKAPGQTRDTSALRLRRDVVSFATAPLVTDPKMIGRLRVERCVRSDREHTDIYARLRDVDGKGRPIHVADGYVAWHRIHRRQIRTMSAAFKLIAGRLRIDAHAAITCIYLSPVPRSRATRATWAQARSWLRPRD